MPNRSRRRNGKISGRVFTTLFASGLVLTLLFGVPFVLRFQSMQSKLDIVRQTWPQAADEMKGYYLAVDHWRVNHPDASQEISEEWEVALKAFNRSPLHEKQILAAVALEDCLKKSSLKQGVEADESLLQLRKTCLSSKSVETFEKAQADLASDESDLLGKVTRTLLRLHATPRWNH